MRRQSEDGLEWPRGSLRWLIGRYTESDDWSDLAATTRAGYESCIRAIEAWADHVAGHHGGYHPHVSRMTPRSIQKFLDGYKDRPTRQRHLLAVMNNLMNVAVREGELDANPAREVVLKRRSRGRGRARPVVLWSPPFVEQIVALARSEGRPEAAGLVLTMWDIGQRPNDLYLLQRLSEFERRLLETNQLEPGCYYDTADARFRVWQSKTGSFVAIPASSETAAVVETLAPAPGANQPCFFINPPTGQPFNDAQFGHLFKRLASATDWPGTTFQMGRHSCVVRLARANQRPGRIASVTGHKLASVQTILDRYWVADDEQAAEAMAERAKYENGRAG